MNPEPNPSMNLPFPSSRAAIRIRQALRPLPLLGLLGLLGSRLLAGLPEPDNLLWGTIVLGTNVVTASRTDVRVEARRTADGPAIASYTLGDAPPIGAQYSLRIPVESWAPLEDAASATNGETLHITVVEGNTVRHQVPYTVGRPAGAASDLRGAVVRLDFGDTDADGDGLSDRWELEHFGGNSATAGADPDGDGASNLLEFLNQSDPNVKDSLHPADLNPANRALGISEITAYALSWKTGRPWPVAPTNIPIDYVTRAGLLWKGGETYRLDTNAAAAAPLWWVNTVVAGPSDEDTSKSLATEAVSRVDRLLPVEATGGETVAVELLGAPRGPVAAWAVEENVPSGWQVVDVSDGGSIDRLSGRLRWGPFFDGTPRTLRYRIVAPLALVDATAFTGRASFDGESAAVLGGIEIARQGAAPLLEADPEIGDGTPGFRMRGLRGRRYRVETSTDLEHWESSSTVETDATGTVRFQAPKDDTAARFFRARIDDTSAR